MRYDMKRLLSFYKLISVIGVCVVIAPLFFMAAGTLVPRFVWLVTFVFFPISVGIGYYCQWLLLGEKERQKKQNVDFNFEQKVTLEDGRRRLSSLLAIGAGAVFGFLCSALLSLFSLSKIDASFARLVFTGVCAVSSFVGARLCRVSFNQLLGVRSLMECCAAFAAYTAIMGTVLGGLPFVFLMVALYSLCLLIEMNQESILQSIGKSDTCYMTPELLHTGLLSTVKVWARSFVFMLALLSLFTTILTAFYAILGIISFRMTWANEKFSAFEIIFYDIPTTVPVINCLFFIGGIGVIVFFCVLLFGRRREWGKIWISSLRNLLTMLVSLVAKFTVRLRYRKKEPTVPSVPLQESYVDTVKRIDRPVRRRALSYSSFVRRLKSFSDAREQFAYAYRTVIALMVQKKIGVEEHHTPSEAALMIAQKTNYSEIEPLTALFLRTAYANDNTLGEEELHKATEQCRQILERAIVAV
ncbi:MAG: hypothetical protein J6B71_09230 [Clostridia bacterium]|nr:hypothetical protein [Clostridia bacterium]